MRFITCRGCKLPFDHKARTCPNCGELFPARPRGWITALKVALFLPALVGLIVGSILGMIVVTMVGEQQPPITALLILGTVLGGILGQIVLAVGHSYIESLRPDERWVPSVFLALSGVLFVPGLTDDRELTVAWWSLWSAFLFSLPGGCWWLRLKQQAGMCWRETARRAGQWHSKLSDCVEDVHKTQEQIATQLPPHLLAERQAILDRGRADLLALRARYTACKWQTELLCWHAQLKLHLDGPAPENRTACEAAVAAIDATGDEGVKLLEFWQNLPDRDYPEPQDCIARLQDLLGVCARLRQSILDHQIILVTRDPRAEASTDDTNFHQLRADLRALETSIIRSELLDPWNTAARIEGETARLTARADLERDLATISTNTERTRSKDAQLAPSNNCIVIEKANATSCEISQLRDR